MQAAKRIRNLSAMQLLTVPYSSVHEDETHQWRGYQGKDKDDLMEFVKETSRGHKFKPAWEVEQTQVERGFKAFLAGPVSAFKLKQEDAIRGTIHEWDDYVRISVGRYLGDIELTRDLKEQAVQKLINAFEGWRTATHSFEEHVAIEIRQAANNYITTFNEYRSCMLRGDVSAFFDSPVLSQVIQSLLSMLPPEEEQDRVNKIIAYFTSQHFADLPYHWTTSRVYASLQAMVAHGAYQNRDEAIDRLSGIFQDIKHVGIYAPYCDAFVMDKAMAHIVNDPRINLEKRYGVKVFSLANWDRFLAWLDQLESDISQEHRAALAVIYP
jgi:hypothetical protein